LESDYGNYQTSNISGYPRFLTKLFNKRVIEGDAVTMTCHIDGKPNPEVFWTLNGEQYLVWLTIKHKTMQTTAKFGKILNFTIIRGEKSDVARPLKIKKPRLPIFSRPRPLF